MNRPNLILSKSHGQKAVWSDVNEPDEFSTMFEAQLNLNDDRSLEEDVLPNPFQEIQCEEADSEPIVKKTRQLSILDFCKK